MSSAHRDATVYAHTAEALVRAYGDRDAAALDEVNRYYGTSYSFDDLFAIVWRRIYAVRQRLTRGGPRQLQLTEAQLLLAQDAGFGSWDALLLAVETGDAGVPAHAVDAATAAVSLRRPPTMREWDELIDAIDTHGIARLDANGYMTDDVMRRVAACPSLTSLSLGGSRQLTDEGLLALGAMPQLERLELNEYPGGRLTDRGLEVLRRLPALRTFEMMWQKAITDAGAAHLRHCEAIEAVDLMGSPTGDGVVAALEGKPHLRRFGSGRLLTAEGVRRLHGLPRFTRWHGPRVPDGQRDASGHGARLLIDGPIGDEGIAHLAGLDGVAELDLFWHVSGVRTASFAALAALPGLVSLAADGALSDDEAMRHFASIPDLRALRAQESAATDDGYEALARSRTLQGLWGREAPHLTSRGFRALATLPSLRALGVSLRQVDDAAVALLPDFPSLRELTPIGLGDEGFRHVGRCTRLERLTCMYCRDTTDAATAHIAALPITFYYAGLTQITDRSLDLLAGMPTLEQVDLYECQGVTDAGVAHLARLPRLREVNLDGLPGVTLAGTKVFAPGVKVGYTT